MHKKHSCGSKNSGTSKLTSPAVFMSPRGSMVTSHQTSEAGYRMLVNWISLPCIFMHCCVFYPPTPYPTPVPVTYSLGHGWACILTMNWGDRRTEALTKS